MRSPVPASVMRVVSVFSRSASQLIGLDYELQLAGLHSQEFFLTIVVGVVAVNTCELDWTFRKTIICASEGKLPAAQVAVDREIPLTIIPFEHRATSHSNFSE